MKTKDLQKIIGQTRITKRHRYEGGDPVIILDTGWVEVYGMHRYPNDRFYKDDTGRQHGVAVAVLRNGRWLPAVIPPGQIEDVTPHNAAAEAKELREHQARVSEAKEAAEDARYRRISTLNSALRARGIEGRVTMAYLSNNCVSISMDNLEELLEIKS